MARGSGVRSVRMPGQGRLGDKAQIQCDAHGCPGCPHPGVGPGISGSPNVMVNGRPALRVDDFGIHAVCCGPNMWQATQGSATVFINGKAAFRKNDPSKHCGGNGKLIEGSDDVIIGDAGGGGSSGGGGSPTSPNGAATTAASAATGSAATGAGGGGAAAAAGQSPGGASGAAARVASDPQPAGTHVVEVRVVDEKGAPLPSVTVTLLKPDGSRDSVNTNADGIARWEQLDAGDMKVIFDDRDHVYEEPR